MTKDEAIEVLIANYPPSCYGKLREAFDEAIESLETDVSNAHNTLNALDTISRDVAIDALCKRCDLVSDDDEPCAEECNDIKILKLLPSAQPDITGMCYIQEALDVLEIYKRNMIHILGDQDEKVKVIETCQMLISELEENKDN